MWPSFRRTLYRTRAGRISKPRVGRQRRAVRMSGKKVTKIPKQNKLQGNKHPLTTMQNKAQVCGLALARMQYTALTAAFPRELSSRRRTECSGNRKPIAWFSAGANIATDPSPAILGAEVVREATQLSADGE